MKGKIAWIVLAFLTLSMDVMAETPTVSFAFVGDIMLDDTPGKVIRQGRDPFAQFSSILKAADFRVGNLECVIAKGGKKEPNKPYTFLAHPRTIPVLKRHFDAVTLANNHSGDFGAVAFKEMLTRLDKAGVGYFGGGKNLTQAHTPLIVERKGLRVALLGYNEFLPRKFEADFDKPGIAWSEDEQVVLDIKKARANPEIDLVIPVMHWCWENETLASRRQERLARLMIDAGADAVIGGHPHVTQNVETYKGKPIIYSLGNFVFDGFPDKANNTGWLLKVDLDQLGVVRWQTVVALIDREGIPRPSVNHPSQCWVRSQESTQACKAQ